MASVCCHVRQSEAALFTGKSHIFITVFFFSNVLRQTRSQVALHGDSIATWGGSQHTKKVRLPPYSSCNQIINIAQLHLISRKHLLKHSLPPMCTERFLHAAIATILRCKRKRSYFLGESDAPHSQRVSLHHGALFRKPSCTPDSILIAGQEYRFGLDSVGTNTGSISGQNLLRNTHDHSKMPLVLSTGRCLFSLESN